MVIAVAAMSIAVTATYFITDNLHDTMGERLIVEVYQDSSRIRGSHTPIVHST